MCLGPGGSGLPSPPPAAIVPDTPLSLAGPSLTNCCPGGYCSHQSKGLRARLGDSGWGGSETHHLEDLLNTRLGRLPEDMGAVGIGGG